MNVTTGKLLRYPSYKDSGVDWLGQIPAHWVVHRLKTTVTSVKNGIWGYEPVGNESDIVCIRVADFDRNTFSINQKEYTLRSIPLESYKDYLLHKNDLLIEKSGGGDQQLVGTVVLFNLGVPAVCSNFVARIEVSENHFPRYLVYLHAALYGNRVNVRSIKQTTGIQNLDIEQYFDELICLPPFNEQRTIANFLDQKTAQIDELITKFGNLLTLLTEKRQTIIKHAVTRGIHPNVKLRDSDIDWIGDIPEYWEIVKIKYVAGLGNGSTPLRDNKDYWEDGTFPWLTSTVVNDNIIGESQQFVTEQALQECHLPIVRPNSVLIAITGQGKTRGMSGILQYEATINQHLAFISPELDLLNPNFLHLYLSSLYEVLRVISEGSGSTRGALTIEQLSEFPLILPPLKEQHEIADYLEMEIARLDELNKAIQETIQLLLERRSALITAAVFGKIRVTQ